MSRDWSFKLLWQLKRFVEKLGWLGQVCAVSILALMLFYGLIIVPKAAELSQMNNTLSAQPVVSVSDPNQLQLDSLREFALQFPSIDHRSKAVHQWMAVTKQHGLQLDNINYRATHKVHDVFEHYFVEFGFHSSYPEAHDYLAEVLSQMPFVSVEHLEMKRENIWQNAVNTSLKLGFHFRRSELDTDREVRR